ncbi:MAG: nucleoside monophosphate kinase [Parcubacteria group bacterium]|nr:nucleoside monophosphate kinase [Parcubacteria group bacterium]MBI2048942.1 nucleoside monophosphate kinase [Parcubacteria group bacterium]
MRNFYAFIGKSGCGKGTQAELLKTYLLKKDPSAPVLWFGSGDHLREIAKGKSHTAERVKEYISNGWLIPEFLITSIWADFFIAHLEKDEQIILDGTPRKIDEAHMLDGATEFYQAKLCVIYIDVSREWAMDKLLKRGRADDTKESINERLDWYESDILPTIEFFKNHPKHTFLDISGEQAIEEVHQEIIKKLN